MQVNLNSISSTRRFLSGAGSIGGIALPNFNGDYMYSKKKSGISEGEYRKQIIEQARQDYQNGKFQNRSDGFVKLMKRYTSEVSPDRESIITSGLKAVSKNQQDVPKPVDMIATLLEGKIKYQKLPYGQSDYMEFYDSNGEMVATYSNNGWTMFTTDAEAARQTNMCMIYNAAWQDAENAAAQAESSLSRFHTTDWYACQSTQGSINMQSVFEVKA